MTENSETGYEYANGVISESSHDKGNEIIKIDPREVFVAYLSDEGLRHIRSVDGRNVNYVGRIKGDSLNYVLVPHYEIENLAKELADKGGVFAESINNSEFMYKEVEESLKPALEVLVGEDSVKEAI